MNETNILGFSADLAQRRVKWLLYSGVGAGILMLCVVTGLLAWNSKIRKDASRVEVQLNECRMAVHRGAVDLDHNFNLLLSPKNITNVSHEVSLHPAWLEELKLANSISAALNREPLLRSIDAHANISLEPLQKLYNETATWSKYTSRLNVEVKKTFDSANRILQSLYGSVERVKGENRLKLALNLRKAAAPDSRDGTEGEAVSMVLENCSSESTADQFRSDVTELQLQLWRLISTENLDQMVDLRDNQIRPVLLRLYTASEDFELQSVVEQIDALVISRLENETKQSQRNSSLCDLQLELVKANLEQKNLSERVAESIAVLDNERNSLGVLSTQIQHELSRRFGNALRIAWAIAFATGTALGCTFILLTRRVSRDISQHVEALDSSAQDLAFEQLLLSSVISSLPNPMFWKDKEGRYLGCNRSFARWLGYRSAAEIVGKTDLDLPWTDATLKDKCQSEEQYISNADNMILCEKVKELKNGKKFVVLASKTPLLDINGEVTGMVGAYIDISERKVAERKARSLAKIMDECPTEIYVFRGEDNEILEWNKSARESFAYHSDEDKPVSYQQLCIPYEGKTLASLLAPIQNGVRERISFEAMHVRSDGTMYPVHISIQSVEYDGDRVYVACATNLTEYKKLEQQLAQAQKLESIGQLAAGIAHEINTPMQCISGNMEFLEMCSDRLMHVVDALQEQMHAPPSNWDSRMQNLRTLMEENRYDYMRKQVPMAIQETSQAAVKVVEIVRAMKVMSHPGTKNKVITDLNGLIRDAATISRNRWKYAAEMIFDFDENIPLIDALPAELSQVFLNLIVNAADAIVEKYGANSMNLGRINIRTSFNNDFIQIDVSDDGNGMPVEVQQKAFEPFFTTKEVGKGTGQGLSIAYDVIVKLHDGTIQIDSTEGVGTTFRITMARSKYSQPGIPSLTVGTSMDYASAQ